VHVWAVLRSSLAAPPPSPNFLLTSRPAPFGAPLRFPHELVSRARANQRARAPSRSRGWEKLPPPPVRPSLLGQAQPGPVPARPSPGPARPALRRSLPPSRSVPARAPTLLARAESTRPGGASRAIPGRGGDREAADPASLGGTPRPRRDPDSSHVSLGTRPARPLAGRPPDRPPARAAGTWGSHLSAASRCPARPAWASAEGPDVESHEGNRRPPAQGRVRPGGARAPQTRIGSKQ
jgi:hypothetical protein